MQIKHRFLLCSVLPALLLAPGRPLSAQDCDSISREEQRKNLGRLEKGMFSFGFEFFRTINGGQEESENLCISPFSASMALSMTLNGAEGETLTQMIETLGFSGLTPGEINCAYRELTTELDKAGEGLQIENANSIWIRNGFNPHREFITVNQTAYDAEVAVIDFSSPDASKTINAWVKKQTKEKIDAIVSEKINPMTMLYLINAIYFKGTWLYEFDKEGTKPEEFTLPGGTKIRHDLMTIEGSFAYGTSAEGAQLIELPYKSEKGEFGMVVILPPEGKEIDDFIQNLDEKSFSAMLDALDGPKRQGRLYLPKFKLEYDAMLKNTLIEMGMEAAFILDRALFGKISAHPLFISSVRQKTFVEVNEEGTEAAAVTAVELAYDFAMPSASQLPFTMRVDRPFIFLIVSSDPDAILFFGKVVDPRS